MKEIIYRPRKTDLVNLEKVYGLNQKVCVIVNGKKIKLPLNRAKKINKIQWIYIRSEIEQLEEVMEILRSEKGCPWDRKQTHESLLKYLIEETYIKNKLIFRHPHIFQGEKANSPKDVEKIWLRQKGREGKKDSRESSLAGLPPILRLEKLVERDKSEYIFKKMDKNIYKKLVELIADKENIASNFGDILVYLIIYGKIKEVNTTYQLQKSVNNWEKTLKATFL